MDFPSPHKLLITPGTILTFSNYPFEDGGFPSDKILIVLHCDNSKDIFTTFTFTTSQIVSKKIPSEYLNHSFCSCNLDTSLELDFFYFEKGIVVGDDNFAFNSSTLILFQSNIREREMNFFEKYSIGSKKEVIKRVSSLNLDIFISLLECILKSSHITIPQEERLTIQLNNIKETHQNVLN